MGPILFLVFAIGARSSARSRARRRRARSTSCSRRRSDGASCCSTRSARWSLTSTALVAVLADHARDRGPRLRPHGAARRPLRGLPDAAPAGAAFGAIALAIGCATGHRGAGAAASPGPSRSLAFIVNALAPSVDALGWATAALAVPLVPRIRTRSCGHGAGSTSLVLRRDRGRRVRRRVGHVRAPGPGWPDAAGARLPERSTAHPDEGAAATPTTWIRESRSCRTTRASSTVVTGYSEASTAIRLSSPRWRGQHEQQVRAVVEHARPPRASPAVPRPSRTTAAGRAARTASSDSAPTRTISTGPCRALTAGLVQQDDHQPER